MTVDDVVERFRRMDEIARRLSDEVWAEIIRTAYPKIPEGSLEAKLEVVKGLGARSMYHSSYVNQDIARAMRRWFEANIDLDVEWQTVVGKALQVGNTIVCEMGDQRTIQSIDRGTMILRRPDGAQSSQAISPEWTYRVARSKPRSGLMSMRIDNRGYRVDT